MAEPTLYQSWEANRLSNIAARQTVEDNRLTIEKKRMEVLAAGRAEQAQNELSTILKSVGGDIFRGVEGKPDEVIARLAQIAASSGHASLAADLLGKSAQAREHSMKAVEAAVSTRIKEGTAIRAAFLGVNPQDKDSARAAIAGLMTMFPEDADAYQEFLSNLDEMSPEELAQQRRFFIDQATSAVDEAKIQLDQARTKTENAQQAEIRAKIDKVIPAQAAAYEALATARRKAGDKSTKTGKAAHGFAKNLIMQSYDASPEVVNTMAADVVQRASDLMKNTVGLDAETAVRQVFTQMEGDQYFAGMRPARHEPGTAAAALPLPDKQDKLRDNLVYQLGDGTLAKWDAAKGKFLTISPEEVGTSPRFGVEGEEEEEGISDEDLALLDEED